MSANRSSHQAIIVVVGVLVLVTLHHNFQGLSNNSNALLGQTTNSDHEEDNFASRRNLGNGSLAAVQRITESKSTNGTSTGATESRMKVNARSTPQPSKHGRIAIVSGFVTSKKGFHQGNADIAHVPRISKSIMPHMLNKQCYARFWGYDYIFNTTWGYPDEKKNISDNVTSTDGKPQHKRHWLEYGTWHRVPHMIAAMEQGYDWVLYADTDYVFQDMTVSLESLVKELELYGKQNVSVIVPTDYNDEEYYTFSAFTVMIRNDAFGRAVLQNWLDFAHGLCPRGNFRNSVAGKYEWTESDQPGLWYALPKTHDDFFRIPGSNLTYEAKCNKNGYLSANRYMGGNMNRYFKNYPRPVIKGIHGQDLVNIPKNQPIIWSKTINGTKSGIGVQQTFGSYLRKEAPRAFALHRKKGLPPAMRRDLAACQETFGCYASYTSDGILQMGCAM